MAWYVSTERLRRMLNFIARVVVVCSDCGSDLRHSPAGPWLGEHLSGHIEYYTRFLPVPEHRAWASSIESTLSSKLQEPLASSNPKDLPQTLMKLRKACEHTTETSPFLALNGIFSFFICSSASFMALLTRKIEKYSIANDDASEVADSESLSNLLHCRKLLERLIEELQYVLAIIGRRGSPNWPQSNSEPSEEAAVTHDRDLRYLINRAQILRTRCETSITLSMNVSSINEARRSVRQNKALFRFTIVASFYVPLSFTASLFGMNFQQFGQGQLSMWVYFLVSVPVFVISSLFLFLEVDTMTGPIRHLWQRLR